MNRPVTLMLTVAIAAVVALAIGSSRSRPMPAPRLASTVVGESRWVSPDRFVVLADWNNEAVFDRKTGLVWERAPNSSFSNWVGAHKRCENLVLGRHEGWRLPSIFELATLIDPSVPAPGPTLPPGHPFAVVPSFYWSATSDPTDSANAWGVGFNIGDVGSGVKSAIDYVWCVRDGDGLQMTPL
jgi:hypothetical protein